MKKFAMTVIMMMVLAAAAFASSDSKSLKLYFDVEETLSVSWTAASYNGADFNSSIETIDNVDFGQMEAGETETRTVYATYKTNAAVEKTTISITENFASDKLELGISADGNNFSANAIEYTDNSTAARIVSNPVHIQVANNGAAEGNYTATINCTVIAK